MRYRWLQEILEDTYRDQEKLSFASLSEEAARIALLASRRKETLIVVKENPYLAARLKDQLAPYFEEGEVLQYLPEESLRAEAIAASYENRADRLYALHQILQGNPKIVVVSSGGLVRHLPDPQELRELSFSLRIEDTLDRDALAGKLQKAGYERVSHVEVPLTYAVRGSIVDVYSINYELPLRIEFFDDIIDSLRFFSPQDQKTVSTCKEAEILFARDVFFSEEEKEKLKEEIKDPSGTIEMDLSYIDEDVYTPKLYCYTAFFGRSHLLDYFTDPLVYLSDREAISEHMRFLQDDMISYVQENAENGELPLRFSLYGDLHRELLGKKILEGFPFGESVPPLTELDLPYAPLEDLLKIIDRRRENYKVIALSGREAEEALSVLNEQHIPYSILQERLLPGINFLMADLAQGYEISSADLVIYTAGELFRDRPRRGRYALKFAEATALNSYEELKKGDYVVHNQYGIGQYLGIEQREVNGSCQDYLRIVYSGNDVLLVPLSQFSLVRKYVSKEGVVPKLHKLGSKQWQKTREKVEADVSDLAKRLVELYALRETKSGYAFSKDGELQKSFEAAFPYELTADQEKAIAEVKADMEEKTPMDRLLCGDVGFGKTEVALRAAFKAAVDHKQSAYLCPTTILSLQHYKTFTERLKDYPVQVALMNRFNSPAEQKEILQRLKEGKIDILIGTHRILSKDVAFHDLGLLIIDEEQRFGVEHKEKIKELKNNIDVLSLSATPIPRTLQMSLVGIYGLSTLDTPPRNRYPIQTYVVEKNEGLIREVIMRELERKGQVFYLYNDINRIYGIAKKIGEEIPYARVAVAHGKMSREEIEDVMLEFYRGEANVLLCTTIIETGIDIPNANTILVEHAENFGLAQLYQIKGRVGRSDRIAYAYLMIPEKKALSEKSGKRLSAIKEFTALGSGYKIAMRDLAIRGAGDLLGDKQSGFIDNVGLDLYLSLLQEAIRRESGQESKEEKEIVHVSVPLSTYIPPEFSSNDYDKLGVYHRLDEISDPEELKEYEKQLSDEYGKLPREVSSLFDKKRLEILVGRKEIESVRTESAGFIITLSKKVSDRTDGYKLFAYCNKASKDIKISYTRDRLILVAPNRREEVYKLIRLTDDLKELEKHEDR
ncbi:MAG: transcription-repair coupling factor [Erysipelotrichaceae bacterium]|nr:transcription-repair coupling factor [Erysipelotrichaceae bacterium]